MLQLTNRTALPTKLLAIPDPDGVEALHVIVKATFALTPAAALAAAQRPVALADVTAGEGAGAWLRAPPRCTRPSRLPRCSSRGTRWRPAVARSAP
nr:hypothetical protein [Deltaproteobacteria bacterium]